VPHPAIAGNGDSHILTIRTRRNHAINRRKPEPEIRLPPGGCPTSLLSETAAYQMKRRWRPPGGRGNRHNHEEEIPGQQQAAAGSTAREKDNGIIFSR